MHEKLIVNFSVHPSVLFVIIIEFEYLTTIIKFAEKLTEILLGLPDWSRKHLNTLT